MVKKEIAAVAVVLLLVAAGLFFFFSQPNARPLNFSIAPSSNLPGFSTLKLSQASNYSPASAFCSNSPAYVFLTVSDGSSASAAGTFTRQQLAAFSGSNPPASGYNITEILNESCTYTILPNPVPVYSYSWQPVVEYATQYAGVGGVCNTATRTISSGCAGQAQAFPCNYYAPACANVATAHIGDVYQIDTVPHYQVGVNVSLQAGSQSASFLLSPTVASGQLPGVFQTQYLNFNFQGVQGCPVPGLTTVLYRALNTNTLQTLNAGYYSSLLSLASVPPTATQGVDSSNTIVNNFLASAGQPSPYCPNVVTAGTTTTYSCSPSVPTTLPVIQNTICASTLGPYVPQNGIPKILGIANQTAAAANTTSFMVTVQNVGTDADTFRLSILGQYQCNLQSTPVSIQPGQIAVAPVQLQCAGIIGNYNITATSVNNIANTDTFPFQLTVLPYCDKAAVTGKTLVNTQYGCFYVCPSSGADMREANCQPFGSFEVSGVPYLRAYNVNSNLSSVMDFQNELHCTGYGTYTTLDNYMDGVLSNSTQPFVAAAQPNAYFIPSPYCTYWAVYGYNWTGQQAVQLGGVKFYDANGNAPVAPKGTQAAIYIPVPVVNATAIVVAAPPPNITINQSNSSVVLTNTSNVSTGGIPIIIQNTTIPTIVAAAAQIPTNTGIPAPLVIFIGLVALALALGGAYLIFNKK